MEATVNLVNTAFVENQQLRKRIFDAIDETPQHRQLFHDVAAYHIASKHSSNVDASQADSGVPPAKKRKLEEPNVGNTMHQEQDRSIILEARDLSFTLPQRKKLHLSIVQYGKTFETPSTKFALCVRNPATNQTEIEIPAERIAHAMRVPVPEKLQKQYNFCIIPSQKPHETNVPALGEGIIWSVNHGPLKSLHINSTELEAIVSSEDVLEKALNAILERSGNKLVLPAEMEFASAVPEAHRKHEKAYHVKAHRGSKDGYLFFLETGIFFGFKKPLAFFPFHEIDSVSYTAVLQRTFNLVVTTQTGSNATEPQEIEFAMLDQADFAGIDAYIKKHQLQDASLAETRRAKQFKVNGKTAVDQEDGTDGQSELQKAQAELEDEEDELEEDYDPGSEGESEGSGTSDEEDDDAGGDVNLVEEELGSEAEEVSEDEDEEVEEENEIDEQSEKVREISRPAPAIPVHSIQAHHVGAPEFDDEDQL